MARVTRMTEVELDRSRSFEWPGEVTMRYAILASPRSGSTLLARNLFLTGHAGDPIEYFSPDRLEQYRLTHDRPDAGYLDFMQGMQREKTSPNGYFGAKFHFLQLGGVFGRGSDPRALLRFFKRFDRFIVMDRKDRIAQALSLVVAKKTARWSSEDGLRNEEEVVESIEDDEIARALADILRNARGWQSLLEKVDRPALHVSYEALDAHFADTMAGVLDFLRLPGGLTATLDDSAIQRQSSVSSRARAERFRKAISA